MDTAQKQAMRKFIEEFVIKLTPPLRLLDVGSRNVNGTHRKQFSELCSEYIGLDISPGRGVDLVPKDLYDWKELEDASFDVIISGSCFEHVEFPWLTMEQIAKKLKPDGYACIVAPSQGKKHDHPSDYFRYMEGGMCSLAKYAKINVHMVHRMVKRPPWHHTVIVVSHLEAPNIGCPMCGK
jgi:SAM-dependent methyltransferase